MNYAIVKTGGKQYRVEEGQTLLVERLRADAGAAVDLETLLSVGDKGPTDGGAVRAEVVGHERGPKLRVVKFKPKRGYKRRTGHRQDLTRIRITSLGGAVASRSRASSSSRSGSSSSRSGGDG